MNHSKVVMADVGELRAAGRFAQRPDAGSRGLQLLVHLDVAAIAEFDAGKLQADSQSVRRAAGGH